MNGADALVIACIPIACALWAVFTLWWFTR